MAAATKVKIFVNLIMAPFPLNDEKMELHLSLPHFLPKIGKQLSDLDKLPWERQPLGNYSKQWGQLLSDQVAADFFNQLHQTKI